MSQWTSYDEDFEQRVRDSFSRQQIMATLGARLTEVAPGEVAIALPFSEHLAQQHGFFHGGVLSTIADSAGGYAAYSLYPPEASVMTVEFKINFLAPADGEALRALGRVIKPGRRLTICDVEVYASKQGRESLCAKMQQTMMRIEGHPGIQRAG
ncbi:PaaI family thioesterase [Aquibaculum sediminis]|uniref:PaaI family thioesterase n=1 Tax=Aquibaculum sediminis TaxID=3231907 RepID=UPI0034535465